MHGVVIEIRVYECDCEAEMSSRATALSKKCLRSENQNLGYIVEHCWDGMMDEGCQIAGYKLRRTRLLRISSDKVKKWGR